jgi:hypothetical protein
VCHTCEKRRTRCLTHKLLRWDSGSQSVVVTTTTTLTRRTTQHTHTHYTYKLTLTDGKAGTGVHHGTRTIAVIILLDRLFRRRHAVKHDLGGGWHAVNIRATSVPIPHETRGTGTVVIGRLCEGRKRPFTRGAGGTIVGRTTRVGRTRKGEATGRSVPGMTTDGTTVVCKSRAGTGGETGAVHGAFPFVAIAVGRGPKGATSILLDGRSGSRIARGVLSGTETFVATNRVDTNTRSVTLVAHGMRRRQTAFVRIENRKGNVKALRHDGATRLVRIGSDGRFRL